MEEEANLRRSKPNPKLRRKEREKQEEEKKLKKNREKGRRIKTGWEKEAGKSEQKLGGKKRKRARQRREKNKARQRREKNKERKEETLLNNRTRNQEDK